MFSKPLLSPSTPAPNGEAQMLPDIKDINNYILVEVSCGPIPPKHLFNIYHELTLVKQKKRY